MSTKKLHALATRLRNGEFRYLFKRVFPSGNNVFYWGRQLVFGLVNEDRFDAMYQLVRSRTSQELMPVTIDQHDKLFEAFPDDLPVFRRRFASGCACYLLLSRGGISGYIWTRQPAETYDTNNLWRFRPEPPGGLWCLDIYVKPQYRMQGVFVFALGEIRAIHGNDGYNVLYGATAYSNQMSIKSHIRIGYEILSQVDVISLFGLKAYLAKDLRSHSRKLSFRFSLDTRKYG